MALFDDKHNGKAIKEQIEKNRTGIKMDIAIKLYDKGFSDDDVEEVLGIIEAAEEDINDIKASLIGTNINPKGDPMKPLIDGTDKIHVRQMKMQQDLMQKITELSKKYENK